MPAKHPPRPGTLAWLAECGQSVYAVCRKCGRYTVPQLQSIAESVGWRASVAELTQRLKCSACGHRGGVLTTQRPATRHGACPKCLRPY